MDNLYYIKQNVKEQKKENEIYEKYKPYFNIYTDLNIKLCEAKEIFKEKEEIDLSSHF